MRIAIIGPPAVLVLAALFRTGAQVRFELPMKRADIADFLGLTVETICRAITRLRASKIIALQDAQTVLVLDPDRLTEAKLSD